MRAGDGREDGEVIEGASRAWEEGKRGVDRQSEQYERGGERGGKMVPFLGFFCADEIDSYKLSAGKRRIADRKIAGPNLSVVLPHIRFLPFTG